ncbi:MarR family transcriptional regulator [Stackebrandtia soli]|uniref:MarR family transcriptional regulator n=1 Tax=Stackebrandtia soli TaxID=1892856 RepID=UPI0039EA981B
MTHRTVPIGHLLARLNRLIDERFAATIGDRGISRRQWQLLNVLRRGDQTVRDLELALAPFLDEDAGEDVGSQLAPLNARGLVGRTGDRHALSDIGRAELELLRGSVNRTREMLVEGLEPGEYERTVATLARMAANLEGDVSSR